MSAPHLQAYPLFPELTGIWTDGPNWRPGHRLTGRLGAVSLAALARHLCLRAGLAESLIDVSGLWGTLEGYGLRSAHKTFCGGDNRTTRCPTAPPPDGHRSSQNASAPGSVQQPCDATHGHAAVEQFSRERRDFQELFAVALHHHVFRRHAKIFG